MGHGLKFASHVVRIGNSLTRDPKRAVTVRDDADVIESLRAKFAANGWSCMVMKGGARDGGVTDALTISAPTDKP